MVFQKYEYRYFKKCQSGKQKSYQRFACYQSAAINIPLFQLLIFCIIKLFFLHLLFQQLLLSTRLKKLRTFPKGRYIPTLTSIGLLTFIIINPTTHQHPVKINIHSISPETIPLERIAIKLAWVPERCSPPNPVPPIFYMPSCKIISGMNITAAATATPIKSPTCISMEYRQVYAGFKILKHFTATAAQHKQLQQLQELQQHLDSFHTKCNINNAAITKVDSVSPLIGLLLEPIIPTKNPETAAKKNPAMIITTVATKLPEYFVRNNYK